MLEKNIHRLFEASVVLKGLHAVAGLAFGGAILALSADAVSRMLIGLAEKLGGASHDFIPTLLLDLAAGISQSSQRFAGIYLVAHGIVNLGLAVGLLGGILWAYPAALAIISGFVAYQVYRFLHTHAISLILLSSLDIVVWLLIWHEYKVSRVKRCPPSISQQGDLKSQT